MIGRRWSGRFVEGSLLITRRRYLLWPGRESRRIPLSSVHEIRSLSATDRDRRRARVTVGTPPASILFEIYDVEFASESWFQVGSLGRDATVTQVRTAPWIAPAAAAVSTDAPAPATSPAPGVQPPTEVMRAGDGKCSVWLWNQGDRIHASLAAVDGVPQHRLTSAEVAHLLLLADPVAAVPAIRTLTGLDDDQRALAEVRTWRRTNRVVVNLSAADLSARQAPLYRPGFAQRNPDGTVRAASGGLPSLNKRRR